MDVYRRMLQEPEVVYENYADDDVYVDKVQDILSAYPTVGVPREPSEICNNVLLGNSANAENIPLLRALGVRYILNCAGGSYAGFRRVRDLYGPETGVLGYDEVPVDDSEYTAIRPYFEKAHAYIDYGRSHGGKVLIHCPGVSRSGAIALSYLIHNGLTLVEATRVLKTKRRVALTNLSFIRQLVAYARERGMLDSDVRHLSTPKYFTPFNRYRIRTAHLF